MGRLFKISLCIAAALSSVAAQNASPPAPLPPAMRSAIDRLTKGTAAGKRVFHFAAPTNPELRDKSLREICSVPLVEMHIDNPERFTMLTATPPGDSRPHATRSNARSALRASRADNSRTASPPLTAERQRAGREDDPC
jgi:hypothetical protein